MNVTACPRREQWAAYVLGLHPEDESLELESHLSQCSACNWVLNALDEIQDSVVSALREGDSSDPYLAEREYWAALSTLRSLCPAAITVEKRIPRLGG